MRIAGLALVTALVLSSWTPASATMRISEDRGGQIGRYLQTFALLRSSGENVIVDGECLSACTLLLGMLPRTQICATSRARFGFHAAWLPDDEGRPVTSALGTRALWNAYPSSVRHWISRHGGLTRRMIYMQGRELYSFVPSCDGGVREARVRSSHHRTAQHRGRYRTAIASDSDSDRGE